MPCTLETLQTSREQLSHIFSSYVVEQNAEIQICDTPGDSCSPTGKKEETTLLHWCGFLYGKNALTWLFLWLFISHNGFEREEEVPWQYYGKKQQLWQRGGIRHVIYPGSAAALYNEMLCSSLQNVNDANSIYFGAISVFNWGRVAPAGNISSEGKKDVTGNI